MKAYARGFGWLLAFILIAGLSAVAFVLLWPFARLRESSWPPGPGGGRSVRSRTRAMQRRQLSKI